MSDKMASTYNNMAVLYEEKDELDHAEEFYLKAISIREELSPKEADSAYNNIAFVYRKKGEFEKAEDFHFKSIDIGEEVLVIEVELSD